MSITKAIGHIVLPAVALAFAINANAAPDAVEPAPHAEHSLGEHPAVIGKRLQAQPGFDYAATFYPHPAWLFLRTEAEHQAQAVSAAQRGS
ncbi:MAG TPA: hypothetical protein VIO33_16120 [Burkholderiaceae bacterium]